MIVWQIGEKFKPHKVIKRNSNNNSSNLVELKSSQQQVKHKFRRDSLCLSLLISLINLKELILVSIQVNHLLWHLQSINRIKAKIHS